MADKYEQEKHLDIVAATVFAGYIQAFPSQVSMSNQGGTFFEPERFVAEFENIKHILRTSIAKPELPLGVKSS